MLKLLLNDYMIAELNHSFAPIKFLSCCISDKEILLRQNQNVYFITKMFSSQIYGPLSDSATFSQQCPNFLSFSLSISLSLSVSLSLSLSLSLSIYLSISSSTSLNLFIFIISPIYLCIFSLSVYLSSNLFFANSF